MEFFKNNPLISVVRQKTMEDEILDGRDDLGVETDQPEDEQPQDQEVLADTTQPIKIGEKEYTPEQIMEIEKKAGHYDALLPDYTRKSQELSELKKQPVEKEPEVPPYERNDWEPKNYQELRQAIKMAEERGTSKAIEMLRAQETAMKQAEETFDNFVAEVKSKDKGFNQKDFVSYAVKHKFPIKTKDDLGMVYNAYSELQKAIALGKEEGRKGREGRRDKIGIPGGSGGSGPDLSDIRTSRGTILDKARAAYERLT